MSVFVNQGLWPRPPGRTQTGPPAQRAGPGPRDRPSAPARRASLAPAHRPSAPAPALGRAEYLAQCLTQHIQAHATNGQSARVEFLK